MKKISLVNLPAQYESEKEEILNCVDQVFSTGKFVSISAVKEFEVQVAEFCGVAHAVALSSGTDALILSLKGLGIGPGDEVITPANSHFASTASIVQVGAQPVFGDVEDDQNISPESIKAAITPHTKAIMPVHLTGRIADMNAILEIAQEHDLLIIEDASQSIGARYHDQLSGSFGHAAAFSAHPLKNLNAAGDAGFMLTNDAQLAESVGRLRHHGLKDRDTLVQWGRVARMDVLQAEILKIRLAKLPSVIEKRRRNAALYYSLLRQDHVQISPSQPYEFNTFNLFVVHVDRRDELAHFLMKRGVKTAIHYPLPLHLQPTAAEFGYKEGDLPNIERQAKRILSLPVHQFLSEDDITYVADSVNNFYD